MRSFYVTPARLLDSQSLYVDFFYNHTPGSAWWFHAIRQLSGSDYLLFDARIGMFIAWLAFAAAIAGFAISTYPIGVDCLEHLRALARKRAFPDADRHVGVEQLPALTSRLHWSRAFRDSHVFQPAPSRPGRPVGCLPVARSPVQNQRSSFHRSNCRRPTVRRR